LPPEKKKEYSYKNILKMTKAEKKVDKMYI